jgi:DNA invertase Pin-like site-specific DNA recombinase
MRTIRAIGIIRVSRSDGRTGESFSSPRDQADRITAFANDKGWDLAIPEPYEIDVSGDALLANRPQLSRAVVAVQTGEAEVIVGAHTERLWWNHETASQVIRLVEDGGGEVWSVDQGLLTRRSAAEEFSGTVRTAADRLARQQNKEKTATAIQRAIDRGVPPWPRVTAGYLKLENGKYAPHPRYARVVGEAFEKRSHGARIKDVRAHLAAHGIDLTYPGVTKLLRSTTVLGEIRYGKFKPNLTAHEPIVSRDVWQAVQHARVPSGRNTKNPRLLARLGVLRCGTCSSRMVASTAIGARSARGGGGHTYEIYRCQNQDCTHRVTISAERVERTVITAVQEALSDVQGRASADSGAQEAQAAAERAQTDLDAAVRAFGGLDDEAAVRRRLLELREVRDTARERADRLRGQRSALTVSIGDWDRLSLDGRRAIVRAVVERVTVMPGRGADRIAVEFFSE